MTQSLYSALAALRSQQYNIDTIAANLSNVNTAGYLAGRVNFQDALYAQMKRPYPAQGTLQAGAGTLVAGVGYSYSDGAAMQSNQPLDMMLSGPGYFTVADGADNVFYTREGAFRRAEFGGTGYLATTEGYLVLNTEGNPIELPDNVESLKVDESGRLTAADGTALGQLALAQFVNPNGLSNVGGNRWAATDVSGAAFGSTTTVVRQGALEASNVDMAQEMSRLLQAQRLYAMLGRSIVTSDEMDGGALGIGR